MHVIDARNVNTALASGLNWLQHSGLPMDSRNGKVLVSPCPVVTTYVKPTERVLFSPLRDANPFFHLMEALWMLDGRDDVAFPTYFNSRFSEYSDNGKTFWGAYGGRWRKWFGYDQLRTLIAELKRDKTTRRAVLTMWDGMDLNQAVQGGKDVPCNTHIYFDCIGDRLNMTVCCRSNDIMWGAYGANAVHFSVLLEFMAYAVRLPVGEYRQFSNNYHIYLDLFPVEAYNAMISDTLSYDLYSQGIHTFPLISTEPASWLKDLHAFLDNPEDYIFSDPFFNNVARPMYSAWRSRKGKLSDGMTHVGQIQADDWRVACHNWITRRDSTKTTAARQF